MLQFSNVVMSLALYSVISLRSNDYTVDPANSPLSSLGLSREVISFSALVLAPWLMPDSYLT